MLELSMSGSTAPEQSNFISAVGSLPALYTMPSHGVGASGANPAKRMHIKKPGVCVDKLSDAELEQ